MKKFDKSTFYFFIISIFFLFFFLEVYSKNISGIIFNGINNKPINNVKVAIKGCNVSSKSNDEGKYSIEIPDTLNDINFDNFENMEVMEIKKTEFDEFNIYLMDINLANLSIDDLMNIKVTTAGKQEQRIAEIPASVVVITRSDIESYGYQSIKEILSNALGMYKIDDYRNVSFGVRGFFSNVYSRNIVFLIDGIPQQQPLQNWNDLNLINLQVESIDRIEFVRGPAAIVYGNDAFFGVINIFTHQKGKETTSSFTTSYGSDNTYRANLQVNSTNETTSLNMSVGLMHTDGRNVPFNSSVDSVQRYDKVWIKDGTTKDFFQQDSRYIYLSIDHKGFYGNLSYDETHRNFINEVVVYDTTKVNRKDQMIRSAIGYQKEINSWLRFDSRIGIENMFWKNDLRKWKISPAYKYGFTIAEAQVVNSELVTFIKPIESVHIILGTNYKSSIEGNQLTDVPDNKTYRSLERLNSPVNVYGVFSQIEYTFSKKLLFSSGFRFEKQNSYSFKNERFVNGTTYQDTIYSYSYNKPNLTPHFATVYSINDKNIVKLIYSQAISRPGTYENRYILWKKHPQLVPQTIATTELNYNHSSQYHVNYNVSVFYNTLDKLINRRNYSPLGGVPVNENNNSGKMTTLGGEFQLLYKPFDEFAIDGSMSYQKTKNVVFNNQAANSPNSLAYLKIIYQPFKNIIFGFNSYYIGSMLAEWDESAIDAANGNYTHKGRIDKNTPGYFNFGTNIRINNILNKAIYASIHIENLLNSEILYPPTTANKVYFPKGTVESGIQINATMGMKF